MKGINIVCRSDVRVKDNSLPTVAVDAGLLYCLKNRLKIILAIGDFDSLSPQLLAEYHGPTIKLPPAKDESDLQVALKQLADSRQPLYVYGALGKRADHSLVNLKLCFYSRPRIILLDDYNMIYRLNPGRHRLAAQNYDYLSFLGFETCSISLQGVAYPLDDYLLEPADNLTLSNCFTAKIAQVTVDKRILVFYSRDKKALT